MKHPPCRWLLEYTVLYPRAKTFPTTLDNMSLQAEEPVPKKPKIEEDSEEEEDTAKPASLERNDQGEAFAALSPKKRLTIRQFKGQTLIDIREVRLESFIQLSIGPSGKIRHSFGHCSHSNNSSTFLTVLRQGRQNASGEEGN